MSKYYLRVRIIQLRVNYIEPIGQFIRFSYPHKRFYLRLFGDGKSVGKLISPAEGWAGVKKENPDLFRTQVNENRAGPDPIWKSGFRNNRSVQAQNKKLFPDLFQSRPGAVMNQQGNILSSFICISIETKFIVQNVL